MVLKTKKMKGFLSKQAFPLMKMRTAIFGEFQCTPLIRIEPEGLKNKTKSGMSVGTIHEKREGS